MASFSKVGEVWMEQEGEVVRDDLFLTSLDFSGSCNSPKMTSSKSSNHSGASCF